ncbi:Conserved hypothetical protein [gamma proteobacterium HdN1]|nr:Conserved hypothetical protein [gamma proteobacterium HdN1]
MSSALLLYPLIGAVAGILAGLLGVGGGVVIVPVLIFAFHWQGISENVLTHMAIGTSLATILMTSLGSIRQHHRAHAVRWSVAGTLSIGLVIGAVMGAWFADSLKGRVIQILFAIFALFVAAKMLFGSKPQASRQLPSISGMVGAGGVIGFASAIFGIGGGSLTVPFLVWCNLRMQEAVGTSAACGFPIALAGASAFVWTGWMAADLPPYSFGYLYLPALVGIAITSVPFAQVGARMAHRLPAATLKKVFAVLLVAASLKLLIG